MVAVVGLRLVPANWWAESGPEVSGCRALRWASIASLLVCKAWFWTLWRTELGPRVVVGSRNLEAADMGSQKSWTQPSNFEASGRGCIPA